MSTEPVFYTIAELSTLFRLPPNSVRRILEEAHVDFTFVGRNIRVAVTELETKLELEYRAALLVRDRGAEARRLIAPNLDDGE